MIPRDARECTFSARLDCRYWLHVPETVTEKTALVVTLHGFGSNPETMLRLTATMFGTEHAIASLQGPNQFYMDTKAEEIGYAWVTRRNPESAVRLHHDMVRHTLEEAGRTCGIPAARRILAGFSQPVGLNYRFAATCPDLVRGVVGVCGGLPSDWETGSYKDVTASVLHIARKADPVYPPEVTEKFPERLRLRAADVEFHMMEGGHTFPSKGRVITEGWLARLL
jgi:phospholipase/carboxylesterase